ncbi:MAG: homocysteine S-methyltransferase family protein, partial [Melioribacteraceae bacterium]|nr:homocysteine S-methyltransferase family protein [Melioribacteraceae bacterium]
ADMIETNSFGGSKFKLDNYGLGDKAFEINEAAAAISRKAAGEKIVLGSIGPSGKILMMGEVTEEELYDAFKVQATALERGGADAIVVETMTDIEEAKIAVKAVKENTSLEVICTMTFDKTVTGEFFTMMGVSPSIMISEMKNLGVDIIGSNCGNGIDGMIGFTKIIREIDANIPILIHANAGMPQYKDGKTVFPETPEQVADKIPDLIKAGANIIGGCCGTTPEHIKKISGIINE